MISGFDVKDVALGTGDTLAYPFDFKIYELTDLRVMVQDGSGNVVEDLRGNDQTYLASVAFDAVNGGGTVTLLADLPDTYVMTMFLDILDPQQPTSFPDKYSLDLNTLESALDYLASCIQSASARVQRAAVVHPLDDLDGFDPTLPQGIANKPGYILIVNATGTGFDLAAPGSE